MLTGDGFRQGIAVGLLALAATLGLYALDPAGASFATRHAVFDTIARMLPHTAPDTDVTIIDIDSDTLTRTGGWPWRRQQFAALVTKLAASKPQAIALDILFEGPDRNGPRSVLSRLGKSENRQDLTGLSTGFPDEDGILAASLDKGAAVILGLGIARSGPGEAFTPLVIATEGSGHPNFNPVDVPGFTGPPPALATAAAGLGVLALDTDRDGKLRRLPLIFSGGDRKSPTLQAAFPLETIRAASGAGSLILDMKSGILVAGAARVPVGTDGAIRLYPRPEGYWRSRTIPAWQVLADKPLARSENRIFVIGSSAPESGAYLPTAYSGGQPTFRIHAAAIDQMRSGRHLTRPANATRLEYGAATVAGLAAIAAGATLAPLWLAGVFIAMMGLVAATTLAAFTQAGLLVDSLPTLLAIGLGALAASLSAHSRIRANKAAVETRFARYMSPAVVDILARNPQNVRIEPQRREVTAIFTDLEGFTPFSERTPPAVLVATLDRYFEMIASIAVRHDGMIDKIVGDAIHVFFNMPLDQPDHVERALGCVREIHTATEAFRNEDHQKQLGVGRTRIGMDTGWATVGDIGGGGKLDYTAHGEAINRAARLQAMARDYASGVLIGEGSVSRLASADGLQLVGEVTPRGLSKAQKIFTLA